MSRPSYYTRGGKPSFNTKPPNTSRVNKDSFYRTVAIFNGIYKKNSRLKEGPHNATDGKDITINFGEIRSRTIIGIAGPGFDGDHTIYQLSCGHTFEGKTGHPVDGSKKGPCEECGLEGAYKGLEHEIQHIIFKSDLAAQKVFCDAYAAQLVKQAPLVDKAQLDGFLWMFVNAFDDLRCNSLWARPYPGSANEIWKRWRRLTEEMGDACNKVFLSYVFAVAFGLPTDPQGEFEQFRPIIEWGVRKVLGRGFKNMLVDVKVVIDHCMKTLVHKLKQKQPTPPPQPPQPQQQNQQAQPQQGGSDQGEGDDGQDDPQEHQDQRGQASGDPGESPDPRDPSDGSDEAPEGGGGGAQDGPEDGDPSEPGGSGIADGSVGADPRVDDKSASQALSQLIDGGEKLDPKEEHPLPPQDALDNARYSHATQALIQRVLGMDTEDLQAIEEEMPEGEIDADMEDVLDKLENGMATFTKDSHLINDVKSRLVMIDVTSKGIPPSTSIALDEEEELAVKHMRATFYKALGRMKARRSPEGTVVDIPALIAYRLDHDDPDVFENEGVQKGFAYAILSDMSGSMGGAFPNVCHAAEMLRQALKFPFVVGSLWGFRGGESVKGWKSHPGEVWVYRYRPDVKGFSGTARVTTSWGYADLPVACGGLTPMNPAIRVTVNHLAWRMSSGMAKRLFLLTDGSPCHARTSGDGALLPTAMLRRFVAKEIGIARKHGIEVFTLVIGNSISDEECKEMFGTPKYWRKVAKPSDVGRVLASLVIDNFQKYLKTR